MNNKNRVSERVNHSQSSCTVTFTTDSSDDEVTEEIVLKIPEPQSNKEGTGLSLSAEKSFSITTKVKRKKSKPKSSTTVTDKVDQIGSKGEVIC